MKKVDYAQIPLHLLAKNANLSDTAQRNALVAALEGFPFKRQSRILRDVLVGMLSGQKRVLQQQGQNAVAIRPLRKPLDTILRGPLAAPSQPGTTAGVTITDKDGELLYQKSAGVESFVEGVDDYDNDGDVDGDVDGAVDDNGANGYDPASR